MSKPVVVTVFGTRPEAIKMAPVVMELKADPAIDHKLVVTAQHRELLDEVLELFELTPDYDLNLMEQRQSLDYITAQAITGIGKIFDNLRPRFVLVHGDTTTTMAAAIAAFYRQIPIGHVEAGLRTSTVKEPFPEELNRRIVDLAATHYYCPTLGSANNLAINREYGGRVFITGNTALDAVRLVLKKPINYSDQRLAEFAGHNGPKIIVTAHRRENWGRPLEEICRGIMTILADFKDARVCFCWHPNPLVRETVGPLLQDYPGVMLVSPPRFDEFANLVKASDLVMTDSGGIQEEISLIQKFALVLRKQTERPEAISSGFAELCNPEAVSIRASVGRILPKCLNQELPLSTTSPFGDGYAACRVKNAIRYALKIEETEAPEDWLPDD